VNPGDLPERYEIIRELGRGGAGITYLARDSVLGREVVVKLLHFGLLGDWKAVELFEREAAVLRGCTTNISRLVSTFSPPTGMGCPSSSSCVTT